MAKKGHPMLLLINDAHGIYVPKMFADNYGQYLNEEQKKDLTSPDNEFYWETWEDVVDTVKIEI